VVAGASYLWVMRMLQSARATAPPISAASASAQ